MLGSDAMIVSLFDSNGRLVQTLDGDPDLVILPTLEVTGYRFAEGGYTNEHHMPDGEIVPTLRPPCPATASDRTLLNLPTPCRVQVEDTVYDCDETTVELEFDQPGSYKVTVFAWPYLNGEYTLEN